MTWPKELTPSFTDHDRVRKLACLFAGLGHMQPLLLATTNANYLLDRFCMERCCSSEYISRIVTSLIFMEIVATLVVAGTVVTYSINNPDFANSKELNEDKPEGQIRRYVSIATQCFILLGYFQIFYAFTTGGRKGHMEWFYLSLAIQYFFICIIAGAIGFWDVEHALWYLMAIPMGPIPVFFYQLYIHSWIRSHGPRDVEYLVVEYQIWLAICISSVAIACWIFGYAKPYTPVDLNPASTTPGITKNPEKTRTLKVYDVNLTVNGAGQAKKEITISAESGPAVNVTIHSITVTAGGQPVTLYPGKVITVESTNPAKVTIHYESSKNSVTIEITKTGQSGTIYTTTRPGGNVNSATISKITLEHAGAIKVTKEGDDQVLSASEHAPVVTGYTCYPNYSHYISGISSVTSLWKSEWDGGKCFYAEYYKNNSGNPALLKLCISGGLSPGVRYFGTNAGIQWYELTNDADFFNEKLKELLATGQLNNLSSGSTAASDPGYNTSFKIVLFDGTWKWSYLLPWNWGNFTPVKYPLIMQGLSVGAVGSIFPNLIPKTLTCPRTSRTLSVVNMFLVPLPHIINLALADNGCNPSSKPWEWPNLWQYSWLLYIFYILAILFAIFNVHYPEWRLSCWIRSHGWMPLMMTIFTNVLNEVFNAISRGGIMTQRSAKNGDQGNKLNHPLLWNKMACLMSLSYLPFWLTTTPMMKSYVSSLDPFLCDKDRDHWPTARYGAWRSGWYWCKCACRGLYTSPRKLVTLNMRKALTRKDPKVYFLVTHDLGVLLMMVMDSLEYHHTRHITFESSYHILLWSSLGRDSS